MSARDPHDGKMMPPNGNDHISVSSLRGVRKITPGDWNIYTRQCKPDIIFALSDMPFINSPYSQKRLTKSIQRSAAWLASLLQPQSISPAPAPAPPSFDEPAVDANDNTNDYHPNIFIQLVGSTSLPARRAFADSLIETLDDNEADALRPLHSLDDGVHGYVFDLVPLRGALSASNAVRSRDKQENEHQLPTSNSLPLPIPAANGDANLDNDTASTGTSNLIPLLQASLFRLPPAKPRIVNSSHSPHEMLRLIRDVGIDIFDARWALDAANIGVGLDFVFPALPIPHTAHVPVGNVRNGKRDLGHNFYDEKYEFDFGCLAGSMRGAALALEVDVEADVDRPVCPCAACSPVRPRAKDRLVHDLSGVEDDTNTENENELEGEGEGEAWYNPPYTRAYIHHLLHTHEMVAHAWLVMHNLTVLDAFLGGVRRVLKEEGREGFVREMERFEGVYDEGMCGGPEEGLFEEARRCWREVELVRGKGRLRRERAKKENGVEGQGVDVFL